MFPLQGSIRLPDRILPSIVHILIGCIIYVPRVILAQNATKAWRKNVIFQTEQIGRWSYSSFISSPITQSCSGIQDLTGIPTL